MPFHFKILGTTLVLDVVVVIIGQAIVMRGHIKMDILSMIIKLPILPRKLRQIKRKIKKVVLNLEMMRVVTDVEDRFIIFSYFNEDNRDQKKKIFYYYFNYIKGHWEQNCYATKDIDGSVISETDSSDTDSSDTDSSDTDSSDTDSSDTDSSDFDSSDSSDSVDKRKFKYENFFSFFLYIIILFIIVKIHFFFNNMNLS